MHNNVIQFLECVLVFYVAIKVARNFSVLLFPPFICSNFLLPQFYITFTHKLYEYFLQFIEFFYSYISIESLTPDVCFTEEYINVQL